MKNKGFAVTGIIYTLMVIFIILIITLLAMFNNRKGLLDKLKDRVLEDINSYKEPLDITFSPKPPSELSQDQFYEYSFSAMGYYQLSVRSINGKKINVTFYFNEGETIYIKVGTTTFNNGTTDIYLNGKDKANLFVSIQKNGKYTLNKLDDRVFLDVKYEETTDTDANVGISYNPYERENTDLDNVRYIKDCLYTNSSDGVNEWSEISAIYMGENKALNRPLKWDNEIMVTNPETIVDGNITTRAESTLPNETEACVIVDLGRTYNLDAIYTWHNYTDNRVYYERYLSVSDDNETYIEIDNLEQPETEDGLVVSSFDKPKVMYVGDIALPVKKIGNEYWTRIFHHNNKSGTVLWDARNQVLKEDGYSMPYKTSGLYYLDEFIGSDNKYDFRLEYPELGADKYIRWRQTSNFVEETSITGFQKNHNDFNTTFAGLKLSQTSDSVIVDNNDKIYIGALRNSGDGIMGPNDIITGVVDLWVKISEDDF